MYHYGCCYSIFDQQTNRVVKPPGTIGGLSTCNQGLCKDLHMYKVNQFPKNVPSFRYDSCHHSNDKFPNLLTPTHFIAMIGSKNGTVSGVTPSKFWKISRLLLLITPTYHNISFIFMHFPHDADRFRTFPLQAPAHAGADRSTAAGPGAEVPALPQAVSVWHPVDPPLDSARPKGAMPRWQKPM
jgi:hypothetical protein